MQKKFCLLLSFFLLLLLLSAATAEELTTPMWVKTFADAGDRLKLRAEPSDNASILGKYYSGVPVTVLEKGSKWCHVRVGGRTGYMMMSYLTDAESSDWGVPCLLTAEAQRASAGLYAAPSESSAVTPLPADAALRVIGVISEDWLHVAYGAGNALTYGYARTRDVTRETYLTVDTGERDKRLNLRTKPDRNADSLVLAYNGTAVYELFTYDDPGSNWTRVRLGSLTGYMLTSQLSSAALPDWQPPVAQAVIDACPTFAAADAEDSSGYLGTGAYYTVLGSSGTRCLVKLGQLGRWDSPTVWVEADVLRFTERAASALGKLTKDTQFTDGTSLASGTSVHLIGSLGAAVRGYIDPSLPQVEISQNGHTASIDRMKLIYDSALNLPALQEGVSSK